MKTTSSATASLDQLLSHRDWLAGLARALVGDPNQAQDLEQETWRAAVQSPPKQGSGRGWLATVLRNRARDAHRRETRRAARQEAVAKPEATASTASLAERAETQRIVIDAVLALDEPYKSTVLLRYFEGLSPAEVATRMGVPASTVRTRLQRAHDQLRASMHARYGGRRGWVAALTPLAWPNGAGAAGVATGSMKVLLLALAAAFAVVSIILVVAFQPWATKTDAPSGEIAARSEAGPPALEGRAITAAAPDEDPVPAAPAPPPVEGAEHVAGPVDPFPKPRFVRALVVGPDGAPLRKVTVRVVSVASDKAQSPGTVLAQGITDGTGAVRLGPVPPTAIARLWANDDSHAAVTSAFKGFTVDAEPVRIQLSRSQTVGGALVEPDGTAVVNARVTLHSSFPGSFEAIAWTRTDDEGRFAFPHVPRVMVGPDRSRDGMLEAAAPGFTEAWLDLDVARDYDALRFEINRERRIRGRLVAADGTPLGGIPIELPDSNGGQQSRADGTFEIPRLPPRPVTVRFSSQKYVVHQVRVPFDGTRLMDIGDVTLRPGAVLEGRVVDADGRPIAGCHIAVDSQRVDQIVRQGGNGDDGTFRFEHLGDEEHTIHVFTGSGATIEQKGVFAGRGPVEVVLVAGPHILVKLVDAETEKPLPVKAVRFVIIDGDEGTNDATHARGGAPLASHRIQLDRPGLYRIQVEVEGYAPHTTAVVEVTLQGGAIVTARLKRP